MVTVGDESGAPVDDAAIVETLAATFHNPLCVTKAVLFQVVATVDTGTLPELLTKAKTESEPEAPILLGVRPAGPKLAITPPPKAG
jgi:hypothetical protein